MLYSMNDILLAARRAHTPQFDRMDAEIRKYALEQMRAALTVAVADLVKAGRSILDNGADPEDGALDTALEPFEEIIPYFSTVYGDGAHDLTEAQISAALSSSPLSAGDAGAADGEPVAWPIDTDDQVEALARECEWDNRKYMTPKDYAIWCERMRKFARLAALSAVKENER